MDEGGCGVLQNERHETALLVHSALRYDGLFMADYACFGIYGRDKQESHW